MFRRTACLEAGATHEGRCAMIEGDAAVGPRRISATLICVVECIYRAPIG